MIRRNLSVFWIAAAVGMITLALTDGGRLEFTGTAAPTAAATPSYSQTLLAAAQAEGELNAFICCQIGDTVRPLLNEFQRKFGIRVTHTFGSSHEQADKVIAEQRAGRYTLDVWMGGDQTAAQRLIPNRVLRPLHPLLFHPEVLDKTAWETGRLPYMDPPDFNHVFAFVGNSQGTNIAYNTNLVDPKASEIRSYWDLLKPKWRGKLAIKDPREASTSIPTGFLMMNPGLGPDFIWKFLTETDSLITLDERQIVEWVALGKVLMCLNCGGREVRLAKKQGLPVDDWPYLLKEGSYLGHSGGAIFTPKNPPHPNAQKFFVNWWLSREGQISMQKVSGFDSLRVDIPKDEVAPNERRKKGVHYAFYQLRGDFQEKLEEAQKLAKRALASVGK